MEQFNNPYLENVNSGAVSKMRFMSKVYGWMSLALFVTALTSMYVISSEEIMNLVFGNRFMFYVLIFAELGLVWYISSSIHKLSLSTGIILFLLYSILNGVTLSFIFLIYTSATISLAFFVTAGMFAVMSIYGYTTQKDLTSFGSMLYMVLVGVILASIANIFFKNTTLYWIVTYAGVFVFVGLVAYDTQKIKEIGETYSADSEEGKKASILGALSLYLDFINLFLYLLRILGGRRN